MFPICGEFVDMGLDQECCVGGFWHLKFVRDPWEFERRKTATLANAVEFLVDNKLDKLDPLFPC